ncbi:EF-P lysine aminoacylase EpmA [Planctomicrobium sp. SH527]|uniref:EF-P lysine aminoacylase EpmA n=1 Tax=Planctomicrobium sp. SH527 TaxID=3448123 RepID=UPI003F5BF307
MLSSHSGPTASLETLQRRSRLLTELRRFFADNGFWEAQTPILSHDCCVDAWIDPFEVTIRRGEIGYLQTSPEFALKRLLCAGADKVYEVARVFRQEELGPRHNPEFTMIEWYRRGDDHHAQISFVEQMIHDLDSFARSHNWNSHRTESPVFHRLSYEEAFERFAGVSPSSASLNELSEVARKTTDPLPAGIETDRDGLLNLILADQVEPGLAQLRAVFLYDYPASQAALARIRHDATPVAERFELYLDGIEICNGYHELTDPIEQQVRMVSQNQKRIGAGKDPIPDDSRLIQFMKANPLPECAGVALGFDRLAMWILGLPAIHQVIAFPFDRA